jgi:tetratricopeptide (TPR) repeat protein
MRSKCIFVFLALVFLHFSLFGADSSRTSYQLCGRVLLDTRIPWGAPKMHVTLQGAFVPFINRTIADAAGNFKFNNVRPGTYIVIVSQEHWGRFQKTVDISPSFADADGKIFATLKWDRRFFAQGDYTIPVSALAITDNALQLYSAALDLLGKYEAERAEHKLQEVILAAPQFEAAWSYLGSMASQSRQFVRAERYFREALRLDPTSGFALLNMGGILLSEKKYAEALAYNLQAVDVAPNDALAHAQLGLTYFWLGKEDDAEKQLKETKKSDPAHYSYPQLVLSDIYKARKDYSGMIGELEEFLKFHPDSELVNAVRVSLKIARQAKNALEFASGK